MVEPPGNAPSPTACKTVVLLLSLRPLLEMAGREGIEPSQHEVWSLTAIPTRRRPFSFLLMNGTRGKSALGLQS